MTDEIKKGLQGIIVDETSVSQVMPNINSLTYRGYAVQDLCEKCIFEDGHQNNIIDKMQTRKRLYDLVEYEKYNALDEKIYNFNTEGHE